LKASGAWPDLRTLWATAPDRMLEGNIEADTARGMQGELAEGRGTSCHGHDVSERLALGKLSAKLVADGAGHAQRAVLHERSETPPQ
jgi:hypothetical protein